MEDLMSKNKCAKCSIPKSVQAVIKFEKFCKTQNTLRRNKYVKEYQPHKLGVYIGYQDPFQDPFHNDGEF